MSLLDALNRFYYDMSLDELRIMNRNTLYPNITYNSLLYMDLISYNAGCTVSFLAEALHISKSAVTVKVNELIRQGLVTKTQSEQDRRVYFLHVAPAVAEDYRQYDKRLYQAVGALEQRYSREQLDVFADMLELIRENYLEEPG